MDPEERGRLASQYLAARCEGQAKDRSKGFGLVSGTSIREDSDAVENIEQEADQFRQPVRGPYQSGNSADSPRFRPRWHRYRSTRLPNPQYSKPAERIGLSRALCGAVRSCDGGCRLQPDRTEGDGVRRPREDDAGGLPSGHRSAPKNGCAPP